MNHKYAPPTRNNTKTEIPMIFPMDVLLDKVGLDLGGDLGARRIEPHTGQNLKLFDMSFAQLLQYTA